MDLTCPKCQTTYVRRTRQEGVLELILGIFYVYPFRCQLCTTRFRILQWGVRYSQYTEDKRQFERIDVRVPVTFSNFQTIGKGMVTDLSVADCALETSLPLKQGTYLQLQLHIKNGRPPVIVDQAVVRSARHGSMGLQFTSIKVEEKARLNRYISGLLGVPVAGSDVTGRLAVHSGEL